MYAHVPDNMSRRPPVDENALRNAPTPVVKRTVEGIDTGNMSRAPAESAQDSAATGVRSEPLVAQDGAMLSISGHSLHIPRRTARDNTDGVRCSGRRRKASQRASDSYALNKRRRP
ncbi:hypothetical protein ON010_g2677 [Phytophthora cinnamomi]|nr:hypothetical protein ON010_g2677 [Phytophthora cinnamomi]